MFDCGGLPVCISEVPEYEVRGDCIRITYRCLEFYMPIPIAQAAMGRFHRALDQWYETKGVIVPFRPIAAE